MKSIQFTSFEDWKDTEGIVASIGKSLKTMGITLAENPLFEGTDGYAFILLKNDFDKDELYQELREQVMSLHDLEDEDMNNEQTENFVNRTAEEYYKEITNQEYE